MESHHREELREAKRLIAALTAERESWYRERQTLENLLQASDHDRQLIAYEIHDGLVQHLSAALMHLQAFDHLKDSCPDKANWEYEAAAAKLQQCHLEARRLIKGTNPVVLDGLGIVAAIQNLVEEANTGEGPKVEFDPGVDFTRLPPPLENSLYRIVQESLTNARRHSQSDRVQIDLRQKGQFLRLVVRDWGIGFDMDKVKEGHFGLEGIRERARMLGGSAVIESAVGGGTRILVEIQFPVQRRHNGKDPLPVQNGRPLKRIKKIAKPPLSGY